MKKTLIFLLTFIITFSAIISAQDSDKKSTLVITARTNGLPGFDEDKVQEQKILVQGKKMLFENKDARLATLLRLDKKVMLYINHNKSYYREMKLSEFRKQREQYMKRRRQILKQVQGTTHPMKKKLQVEKWGFRLDMMGKVWDDVKPERIVSKDEKKKINGFNCHKVVIKVFGKEAIEAWVTDEVSYPENLLDFYIELGIFGPDVVKEIKTIKDFPVETKININYGDFFKCSIKTEVIKVSREDILVERFDVPPGYFKVEKPEEPKEVACPWCGKMVNVKEAEDKKLIYTLNRLEPDSIGWKFVFDSMECLIKFKRKLTIQKPNEDDE